ncbi:MAG: hypothetical protein ACK4PI_09180 [Tepidisphaerales bacterium]
MLQRFRRDGIRLKPHTLAAAVLAALLPGMTGCIALGYAAASMPPRPVKARYDGLMGQSVAVMVWTERSIRIDFPAVQLDVANGVQQKLQQAQKDNKPELKGTTFPIEPRSVVRFQVENPAVVLRPIEEVAAMLPVSRLIYVELIEFETRPVAQLELFRGRAVVSLRAVEVDDSGRARVAYREDPFTVVFPPKAPPEGILGVGDVRIYQGLVDELTTEIARRFHTYTPEDTVGSGLR